eukprot:4930557-Amphidinium_carterae.1
MIESFLGGASAILGVAVLGMSRHLAPSGRPAVGRHPCAAAQQRLREQNEDPRNPPKRECQHNR